MLWREKALIDVFQNRSTPFSFDGYCASQKSKTEPPFLVRICAQIYILPVYSINRTKIKYEALKVSHKLPMSKKQYSL